MTKARRERSLRAFYKVVAFSANLHKQSQDAVKRTVVVLASTVLALVLTEKASAQTSRLKEQLCQGIGNAHDCAKEIERYQIERHPHLIELRGDTLVLNLKSKPLKLVSGESPIEGSDPQWYTFADYYPEVGYLLVRVQYYEGNAYLIIDERTGRKYHLQDVPIFSPDWSHFVTASMDLEAFFNPTGLQIWRVAPYPYKQWALETEDWGPSEVQWVDRRTFRFIKNKPSITKGDYGYEQTTMYLRREAGEWKLMTEKDYFQE